MTYPDEISILQIVKGLDIGGNNGGAENFGIHLARSLMQKHVNASLCVYLKHGTSAELYWAKRLEKEGIKIFFACSSENLNLAEARLNIRNWLLEHPTDIIHSHYQVGTITAVSLKYSKYFRSLVRTAHAGLEFGAGFPGLVSRMVFQNFVFPFLVDWEVGVSRSITQSLNHQIFRRILHRTATWIPNALPDIEENHSLDDQLELFVRVKTEKLWLVTTVGVLVPGKNLDLLIRAMQEVMRRAPQARLVIVGGGPELDSLVNLARELGISESCWFLGQQQNIHSILEKSNIFVLPSNSEGLSTVILEAMRDFVPVIASDIAGNRELIKQNVNGWLFPVNDVIALAEAIIRAYKQPIETRRLAEEAHKQIGAYSMNDISRQYLELYTTLLKH